MSLSLLASVRNSQTHELSTEAVESCIWNSHALQFTRPNDCADDWQTQTDAHKTDLYTPLRDRIATLLLLWKVEIVTFSLGIRG